ncbi:hypothetical protein LPTSP3_g14860 [Leptospira kobayashii]|uniref:DUF4825 domain-containing protein n=1 Tax=Leptospira kobayashii TaxID=1917830 RepID=A0ABM7UIK7_9LEPT|nr:hypothetical protein [Leptospira kobayashii]BDA78556.1 hypothetical protein LPTSP3_g14860 [Leptospira kobayashii]
MKSTIGLKPVAGSFFLSIIFSIYVLSHSLYAQTNKQDQIGNIRKEYQKINSELGSYRERKVTWQPPKPYEGSYMDHVNYTGYLNSSHDLILLKFSRGEEGYWAEYEYYFKNKELLFIYIYSGEPDGKEKQERIYFWNKKIIQALIKEKFAEEKKTINDLENKTYDTIMNDINKFARDFLNDAETERKKFYQALSGSELKG